MSARFLVLDTLLLFFSSLSGYTRISSDITFFWRWKSWERVHSLVRGMGVLRETRQMQADAGVRVGCGWQREVCDLGAVRLENLPQYCRNVKLLPLL